MTRTGSRRNRVTDILPFTRWVLWFPVLRPRVKAWRACVGSRATVVVRAPIRILVMCLRLISYRLTCRRRLNICLCLVRRTRVVLFSPVRLLVLWS